MEKLTDRKAVWIQLVASDYGRTRQPARRTPVGRSLPARSLPTVILYTCGAKKAAGGLGHPCGRAAKALDEAGLEYELRPVRGYRLAPWTWGSRARDRAEIERLSGQRQVPILVLDTSEVIAGSGAIVRWARESSGES